MSSSRPVSPAVPGACWKGRVFVPQPVPGAWAVPGSLRWSSAPQRIAASRNGASKVSREKLSPTAGGNVKGRPLQETVGGSSTDSTWSDHMTQQLHSRDVRPRDLKIGTQTHVHVCSQQYYSQQPEDGDNPHVHQPTKGKMKRGLPLRWNILQPQKVSHATPCMTLEKDHVQREKPDPDHIWCDSIYMKCMEQANPQRQKIPGCLGPRTVGERG